jgi:hypothetical protein
MIEVSKSSIERVDNGIFNIKLESSDIIKSFNKLIGLFIIISLSDLVAKITLVKGSNKSKVKKK